MYYKLHNKLNHDNIDIVNLCCNPHDKACQIVIDFILKNYINKNETIPESLTKMLCKNTNDTILEFILKYFDMLEMNYISWMNLCYNPNNTIFFDIILKKLETIEINIFMSFCINKNPKINKFLLNNITKLSQINNVIFKLLCERNDNDIVEYILNNLDMILNTTYKKFYYQWCYQNGISFEIGSTIWKHLCLNTNDKILDLISNNLDKLNIECWKSLCKNTNNKSIYLILNNLDKLNYSCWCILCSNTNDKAIELVLNNINKLNYPLYGSYVYNSLRKYMSKNTNYKALEFIMKNINYDNDITVLDNLYKNDSYLNILNNKSLDNKSLMALERNNYYIYPNPIAFEFIINNIDNITRISKFIWCNPNIFVYDYDKLKQNKFKLHTELRYYFINPHKIISLNNIT